MNDFNTLPMTAVTRIAETINGIAACIRQVEEANASARLVEFYSDLTKCDTPRKLSKRLSIWAQLYPSTAAVR